jgi:hypothetical protein
MHFTVFADQHAHAARTPAPSTVGFVSTTMTRAPMPAESQRDVRRVVASAAIDSPSLSPASTSFEERPG